MSVCYVEFSKPIDNYSEVSAFSYGMGASSSVLAGTNRQASMHDASFLMDVDSMSRKVWQASMDGTVFGTVWVEFYKNEDSDEPYMVYTLSSVIVVSVSVSSARMHVGLNFKTMKAEYLR